MPGSKIAIQCGIQAELAPDDEVVMVMCLKAAHALLEFTREQLGKDSVTLGAPQMRPRCSALTSS